ncbi:hypothetical protein NMY22_g5252 [Coprinellus aureogranulatus]|nr:hypothetical protein NMY22_g5252 [Coprinellus aureogranulatus]
MAPFDRSLTATSYPLSEGQHKEIKESLRSRQQEMSTLQEKETMLHLQLDSLQKAKEDVERKIKEIRRHIWAHERLLSPARKLPDDIYREIFLWCLPPPSRHRRVDRRSAPLLLTRVCRRWREIAYATPRLWTHLSLRYQEPTRRLSNTHFVQEWVRRSGALPISVTYDAGSDSGLHPDHLDLFSKLSQSFERWRSLSMSLLGKVPDVRGLVHFFDTQGGSNPFLQVESLDLAVVLQVDIPPRQPGVWDPPNAYRRQAYQSFMEDLSLQRSTKLRRVRLYVHEDLFWSWETSQLRFTLSHFLPCGHLEHLEIGRPTGRILGENLGMTCPIPGTVAYQLLRDSPNLIAFSADLANCPHMEYPPQKLCLKRLQHLSLSFMDLSQTSDLDFLPHLEFPSLTSLGVRCREDLEDGEGDEYDVDALPFLLDALGSHLTKLFLNPCLIGVEDLVAALSKLPSLVQLHLKQALRDDDFNRVERASNGKWGNALLECLTPKPDQATATHFCQKLQYLKWENNTWFSDQALVDFIIQRATSPHSTTPLKQVHIKFGRYMHESPRDVYAQLVQEGLDLQLEYLQVWELYLSPSIKHVWEPSRGRNLWRFADQPARIEDNLDPLTFGWPGREYTRHRY